MTPQVHVSMPAEGVAQLLLDNGPRNFLTWALQERLEQALKHVREQGARVVVLGSAVEGYFLAHGSLSDVLATFGGGTPSGDVMAGARVSRELDTGPMVCIAAVDGQAWGGGAELAWSCDLRVMSTQATFAQPEVRLGVVAFAGASVRIARIAGEAAAARLLLDGRPIGADEALRLGLVHRVAPAGEALSEALGWARWLASHPPGVLASAKRAIVGGRDLAFLDAIKAEVPIFMERFSQEENRKRLRVAQQRYDEGADSWDAFQIPRRQETE